MAAPISAERMVTRIRNKIEDRSTANPRWSNAEILEQIDLAVQYLLNEQAKNRQDHDLDFVDVSVATETNFAGTMAASGQEIREWRVPDYVNKIRLIEDTTESSNPRPIPKAPFEQKELLRWDSRWSPPRAYWIFTKGGDQRTRIGFVGNLVGISTFRVWFIRRAAPLHYGVLPNRTVGAAQVGCTSARLTFALATAATTVGRIINRGVTYTGPSGLVSTSEVYIGAMVEFGLGAGVVVDGVTDEIRKFVGSQYLQVDDAPVAPDTGFHWTWVFDELLRLPLSGATINCAGFNYSLVPQIGPEYHELVLMLASRKLAGEAGSNRIQATIQNEIQVLFPDFLESTQDRQHQVPEFVQILDTDGYP